MMFEKYYSLTNSHKTKFLTKIESHGYANDNWYVTEKVHGANFSFLLTKDSHEIASRNGIIDVKSIDGFYKIGEDFLSLQLQRMRELYAYVWSKY